MDPEGRHQQSVAGVVKTAEQAIERAEVAEVCFAHQTCR
jgi:hypothetical protein